METACNKQEVWANYVEKNNNFQSLSSMVNDGDKISDDIISKFILAVHGTTEEICMRRSVALISANNPSIQKQYRIMQMLSLSLLRETWRMQKCNKLLYSISGHSLCHDHL